MPVENTTPNRNYPLPFRENELRDDVARIISAISGVDLDVANILSSLALKSEDGHGHVISDVTGLAAAIAAKQDADQKGLANGFASLGADGKVPTSQLPAAVLGALSYQGTWNANTNSPTIPAASASNRGWYYKVATPGATSIGGIGDWKVGDWIVSNGTTWDKVDNTESVVSVAGLDGVIGATELLAAIGAATAAQGVKADAALPRADAGILAGHRNKIINGDFDVWQRGTVQTTSGYGSDDRWSNQHSGGSKTHTRTELNAAFPYRFASVTTFTGGAGASDYVAKTQKIENVRTFAGKKATLTFDVASAVAGKFIAIELRQNFGTGGSPSATVDGIGSQKIAVETVLGNGRNSVVIDVPAIGGKTIGTNGDDCLEVVFWMSAGTDFDGRSASLGVQSGEIYLTHVSLVEGDATAEDDPFSPRHPSQEKAFCRHYARRITVHASISSTAIPYGYAQWLRYSYSLGDGMRATPTVSYPNGAGTATTNMSPGAMGANISLVVSTSGPNEVAVSIGGTTGSAPTSGDQVYAYRDVFLDAEI